MLSKEAHLQTPIQEEEEDKSNKKGGNAPKRAPASQPQSGIVNLTPSPQLHPCRCDRNRRTASCPSRQGRIVGDLKPPLTEWIARCRFHFERKNGQKLMKARSRRTRQASRHDLLRLLLVAQKSTLLATCSAQTPVQNKGKSKLGPDLQVWHGAWTKVPTGPSNRARV